MKNKLPFSGFVLAEQARLLENNEADSTPLETDGSFDRAIARRAQELIQRNDWAALTVKPGLWYRRALILAVISAALLGVLAAANALSSTVDRHTLNIYWILLVLLGFNLLSMLLWLIGCVAGASGLIRGSVSSLPLFLQRLMLKLKSGEQAPAAFKGWYGSLFENRLGLWRASSIGHTLWLAYLCAGLLSLIVMFSVRQYDFVWGSTLLSADVFVALTQGLASALQWLGLQAPDASMVLASQNGNSAGFSAAASEARRHWALFLLGVLLLYGILPRLLCLAFSVLRLRLAERAYRPDYYLPYYVELRHRFQPESSAAEIVDPDPAPRQAQHSDAQQHSLNAELPDNCTVLGFELPRNLEQQLHTQLAGQAGLRSQLSVNDRESFRQAQSALREGSGHILVVAVDMAIAPDRGMLRQLGDLFALAGARYLLLCSRQELQQLKSSRLSDWYQAAQQLQVPVEHIRARTLDDVVSANG